MNKSDLLDPPEQAILELIDTTIMIDNIHQTVALRNLEDQLSLTSSRLKQLVETVQFDFAEPIQQHHFIFKITADQLLIAFSTDFSYADLLRKYLLSAINVQILMYLLRHPKLNRIELSQQLNISEATYFRRLQHLNRLLAEFKLEINQGQLLGSELNIRYFYLSLGAIFDLKWATIPNNQIMQEVTRLAELLQTNFSPSIKFNVYWLIEVTYYRYQFMQKSNGNHAKWVQNFVTPLPFFTKFKQTYFNQFHFIRHISKYYDIEASLFFVLLWVIDPLPVETSNYWQQLGSAALANTPIVNSYHVTMKQVDEYFPKMLPFVRNGIAHEIALIYVKIFFTNGYLYRINNLERKQEATLTLTKRDPWVQQFTQRLINTIDENHYLTLNEDDITLLTENFVSIVNNTRKALTGRIKIGLSSAQSRPLVNVFKRHILLGLTYFTNIEIELYSATHQYDYVITNRPDWTTDKAPFGYVTNFGTTAEYHQLQWQLLKVYQQKYSTH